MRQRSALCPRSVQQPLSPSTGAACRSRSAVASATIASRSAAPSAFQRGQSTAYIEWRTYQPSRVTGAALTRGTIARARGHGKGAAQDPASALEGGHDLGAPGSARGGGGRAPPARLRLPRGPAHLPPLGRDHGVRGRDGRERLRPRVPLARRLPAHRPPAHLAPLRRGIHRRRGRHRGRHLRGHARRARDRAPARAARHPARRAGRAAARMTVSDVLVVGGGPAGSARVAGDAGTFTAGVVVGAGGHGCPVARALGRARVEEEVVVTQESETRVGAERLRALTPRHGWPELIAEPDFRGYGWYFTKGDFLNIGVGALGGEPVRRRLQRLLARVAASGRLPHDLALTPFRGHAYAIRRGRPRRVGGERFALVGDAAGLARDVSGEGIGPAVRSGCLAAEALLDGGPATYAARIETAFGRPAGVLARLAHHLPGVLIVAAARLACTRPGFRRRLVLEGAFGIG